MIELDVEALLKKLSIEAHPAGDDFVAHCPHPAHPSRPGKGSWEIVRRGPKTGSHHCFACGFGGGPRALIQARLGFSLSEARIWFQAFTGFEVPTGVEFAPWIDEIAPEKALPLPEGSVPAWYGSETAQARDYLFGRGFSVGEIERYRIHAVVQSDQTYSKRVIVPVFVQGRHVDFVARLYVKASPLIPKALSGRRDAGACKELSLWGYDALDPSCERVVVVEGVWGAAHLIRNGVRNVVASCGSAWSGERTELLSKWKVIILMPDGDAAGRKMVERACSLGFRSVYRVASVPEGWQPDDLDRDEIERTLACAELYREPKYFPGVALSSWVDEA